jgi:hypothetical protein
MQAGSGFKFAIDRGGTFTDVYAELPGVCQFKRDNVICGLPCAF